MSTDYVGEFKRKCKEKRFNARDFIFNPERAGQNQRMEEQVCWLRCQRRRVSRVAVRCSCCRDLFCRPRPVRRCTSPVAASIEVSLLPARLPHACATRLPHNMRSAQTQRFQTCASRRSCPLAQVGGPAVARGHDPVVPRTLWGGVLGVDARQAHQVVRRERHALRAPRRLLGLRARAEKGPGREGVRLRCVRGRQSSSLVCFTPLIPQNPHCGRRTQPQEGRVVAIGITWPEEVIWAIAMCLPEFVVTTSIRPSKQWYAPHVCPCSPRE